jgi:hypothetical protein
VRKISKIGREAMAAAGVKNLAAFRQMQRPNIGAEMDRWRAEMLAELGTSVNARRRALVDGATATYGCIILVINKLRSARIADSGRLLERTSFLVGNLDRLLKRLELPPKPRPRSLSDLLPSKVALTSAIQTEKAAIPVESKVKTL